MTVDKFKEGTNYQQIVASVKKEQLAKLDENQPITNNYSEIKFVPASGAATRMFKDLYAYIDNPKETKFIQNFFDHLEDFAFYRHLEKKMKVSKLDRKEPANRLKIVQAVLDSEMKYGDFPKALIDFHDYDSFVRNPIDEHIVEAEEYLNAEQCNLHFTISKKDEKNFKKYLKKVANQNKELTINYSLQKNSTNTLAVNLNNEPFIKENGKVLYRPGGHGSLIENLNELTEDIVFIKNIDNVCHESRIADTITSKKKLKKIGIQIKEELDEYLEDLVSNNYNLKKISGFVEETLNIHSKNKLTAEQAYQFLNRPLRVCGVVKNQGEPGGGPFIVDNGSYTDLQICETSEINQEDPNQAAILENADYFNPVDLVCFTKDYKGNKFDMLDYINENRYFISKKSYQGRPLKALEHPGLWNGAMHYWNTIFVEVPLTTFNPVKTVNDLLKAGHQSIN